VTSRIIRTAVLAGTAAALAVPLIAGAAGASTGPAIANVGADLAAHHEHHLIYENRLAQSSEPVYASGGIASQPASPVYTGSAEASQPAGGYVITSPAAVGSALHWHHEVYANRVALGIDAPPS
jgi:hypothetical protein